jgi:hypothetical protein
MESDHGPQPHIYLNLGIWHDTQSRRDVAQVRFTREATPLYDLTAVYSPFYKTLYQSSSSSSSSSECLDVIDSRILTDSEQLVIEGEAWSLS